MKIVLAPDKFKGSLTGSALIRAMKAGLYSQHQDIQLVELRIADGGDGFLEVFDSHEDFEKRQVEVLDPLLRPVLSPYLYSSAKKKAILEMSEASGLKLLHPSEYDCLKASSIGTGQLIAEAIRHGAHEIVLGIGGSATTDGGTGMAQALGFGFLDNNGKQLPPNGDNLVKIREIVFPSQSLLANISVQIASDVDNPLIGPKGAARIYAPQKGASQEEVEWLEAGMINLQELFVKHMGLDIADTPGAGAAGGVGAGAMAFLDAQLVRGVDLIFDLVDFDRYIRDADFILFAEGKVDEQSFMGKPLGEIIRRKNPNTKLYVICGQCDLHDTEWKSKGIDQLVKIIDFATTEQDAIDRATELVAHVCSRLPL